MQKLPHQTVYLATREIKTTDIFMSIQSSSQTDTLGIWAINGAQHGDSSDSSKEELLEYYSADEEVADRMERRSS